MSLSGATTGALASEDYAGNIGNQILERFKCTFDYDRHAAVPGAAARSTPSAITSHAPDSSWRATATWCAPVQVVKRSPAEHAGIRAGDQVISVEGRPIGEYGMDEINQLFEDGEVGRTLKLEISRDGRTRSVKLTLKELI